MSHNAYNWYNGGHLTRTPHQWRTPIMNIENYSTTKFAGVKANSDATEILLDFRLNKKRYRKKLQLLKTQGNRTDRIKKAYSALEEYKAEIAHSSTLGDIANMNMNTYFKRTEALSERSPIVKKRLEQFYDSYVKPTVGDLLVKDVKPAHITTIMSKLKELGYALSTRKKALEVLVPIFKLAIDEDVINKSPIKKIHNIKRDSKKEKKIVLNAEEKYRIVYKQIFLTFHHNPKIMALVLFCFHGRRKTEASKIKWADIDLKNRKYLISGENSKVGIDMEFALPDDIARILPTLTRVNEYVFYSEQNFDTVEEDKVQYVTDIRHHVHNLRDDTGIPELTLHWLRNLAVSALSSMGVSALELSTMLGHTDPNTLRQYLTMQREATTKKINQISQKALLSK